MNRLLFALTLFSALVLSGLTLTLPVLQWANTGIDNYTKLFLGAAALAVGICKICFFPIAENLLQHQRKILGCAVWLFGAVAMLISIYSTGEFLTTVTQQKTAEIINGNEHVNQLRTELKHLNQQSANLTELINNAVKNNYRSQALNAQNKLELINQQINTKGAELSVLLKQHTNTQHSQNNTGLSIGVNGTEHGFKSPLFIAIALHTAVVLCVLIISSWQPIKPHVKQQSTQLKTVHHDDSKTQESTTVINAQLNFKNTELDPDQQKLCIRIIAGEFGNEFKMKDTFIIPKVLTGGHKRIKPVFDFLTDNNHIVRVKTGYALTQTTIAA